MVKCTTCKRNGDKKKGESLKANIEKRISAQKSLQDETIY
jgi:hypothetical protein